MKETNDKIFKRLEKSLHSLRYPNVDLPLDFQKNLREKFLKDKNGFIVAQNSFLKPLFIIIFFFIVLFSGVFIGKYAFKDDSAISSVAKITVGEPVTIRLIYNSNKNVDDVVFTVKLSDALKFVSKDVDVASAKELSWDGVLKKGKNEIPFVVEGLKPGSFDVLATAIYKNNKITHKIKLVISGRKT